MLSMMLARNGVSILRAIACLGFGAFFISSVQASRWDTAGAIRAYQEASQKRIELSQAIKPALNAYLECAKTYRKVYLLDPHYRHSPESIYQEGLIFQEMGDYFSDPAYYKKAVGRFSLLVKDYGGNQNCPDALRRMHDIFVDHLNNGNAAQETYQLLETRYGRSSIAGSPADMQFRICATCICYLGACRSYSLPDT